MSRVSGSPTVTGPSTAVVVVVVVGQGGWFVSLDDDDTLVGSNRARKEKRRAYLFSGPFRGQAKRPSGIEADLW